METPKKQFPWRKNVLLLFGAAYAILLAIFIASVAGGGEPVAAYEAIKEPVMSLVGGSLVISKDLLQGGE